MRKPATLVMLSLASFALLFACRRSPDPGAARASSDSVAAPAVDSAKPLPPERAAEAGAAAAELSFAFTEADLDALQRGMEKEIELVLAARDRERSATTPEQRAQAAQAQWETQTAPEAARLIGANPDRYLQTRRTVDRVFETLDFQGKIDGPKEMNMELAPPEMRQRLASDPFAELAPGSVAALRARMDRLVPIWIRYTELMAVAG